MSENKLKRVSWRAAVLLEGTEPLLVKVSQASETQLELISLNSLKAGLELRLFLELHDVSHKKNEYFPMQIKVMDSVLVASAHHFRCNVKVSQIDSKPQSALRDALELVN
ncbi:hypothetical protein [Deefgea rivuli]|uniref:hypothetical protein n=1 Tax=Deefgea rivuli TaxID=400948 RepID=UPI0004840347|nr:hypothetical protein [Deefgea rivuli]